MNNSGIQVHVQSTFSYDSTLPNVVLALAIAVVGVAFLMEFTPGFIGRWAVGRRIRPIGAYLIVVAAIILVGTYLLAIRR